MAQKLHVYEPTLAGAVFGGGAVAAPWHDTLGVLRLNAYVEHLLFAGTILVEGSFDGVTNHGTLFTVTAGTLDVDGVAVCVPFARLNVTVFNAGTIVKAWLFGQD